MALIILFLSFLSTPPVLDQDALFREQAGLSFRTYPALPAFFSAAAMILPPPLFLSYSGQIFMVPSQTVSRLPLRHRSDISYLKPGRFASIPSLILHQYLNIPLPPLALPSKFPFRLSNLVFSIPLCPPLIVRLVFPLQIKTSEDSHPLPATSKAPFFRFPT